MSGRGGFQRRNVEVRVDWRLDPIPADRELGRNDLEFLELGESDALRIGREYSHPLELRRREEHEREIRLTTCGQVKRHRIRLEREIVEGWKQRPFESDVEISGQREAAE